MMELWLASTLAIRLTATPSRRAPSAPRETRKPTPRSPRRLRLSRYPHSPGSFPSGSSPRRAVPGSYRPARNSPCRAGSVSFRPWSIPLSCAQHGHAAGCIALQRLADLLFHAIKRGLIFAQRAVAQLDLVSLDGGLEGLEPLRRQRPRALHPMLGMQSGQRFLSGADHGLAVIVAADAARGQFFGHVEAIGEIAPSVLLSEPEVQVIAGTPRDQQQFRAITHRQHLRRLDGALHRVEVHGLRAVGFASAHATASHPQDCDQRTSPRASRLTRAALTSSMGMHSAAAMPAAFAGLVRRKTRTA